MSPEMDPRHTDHELHEAARKIAANLGWDWEYSAGESYERSAAIVGPDGATVLVSSIYGDAPDGRYAIRGEYPYVETRGGTAREWFDPPRGERARITVSKDRPPHSIARDILRRLLPLYLPQYQEGLKRKAAFLEKQARRGAALDKVVEILGSRRPDPRDGTYQTYVNNDGFYGRVSIDYNGDTARIDLSSVPIQVVYQIAELLASFR